MRILFSGGGTLGSVTPLLAVVEELKRKNIECLWIGTRSGPERKLIGAEGIQFSWIWAPKLRRYFDVRTIFVPLILLFSTLWALALLIAHRPAAIVTAGGFVGVPIAWAGWLLRIPSLLHNQDVRWSLANRLVAPFARRITYALPGTVPARFKKKAVWTGNPVRSFVFLGKKDRGLKICGFSSDRPVILILGGGTGALRLNEIVAQALPRLVSEYQVVHLTGKSKNIIRHSEEPRGDEESHAMMQGMKSFAGVENDTFGRRYCAIDFVTRTIADLFAAADLVITRAGMGTLSELAVLAKPMIIVPISQSHQVDNARFFERNDGAIVLDQRVVNADTLVKTISTLLKDKERLASLGRQAGAILKPNAAKRVVEEIIAVAV